MLSSEACAISRLFFFTLRTRHAGTQELQRRRTTQLSGSLQASPQVPSQTTGVAGARLEEYVYLQVVRFTIETLEVADEISVGYRIITYCQPSQKCVDQEVKAASQRHEDGSEPILAVVSSEYVTFKHIWYFYSLPLVIMSHGHPNTDYEDYWQNNELGALEALLSLLARATWNLVVSVEISEQRNLDLENVAQELVQRNGQEICIELNYQGCFCVGKYSQLAKEMINYRQVCFDLGL
ncbi:UNVERIFIED_CONTAM: hypothetical protein FKN15_038636 [Acipenser sinensis]